MSHRLLLVVLLALPSLAIAADWPTAAHDAARSGRTVERDLAKPPYRVRWAKAWQYENIATAAQLVVAEGRGFIGTLGRDNSLAGRIHCVDVKNGADLWTYSDLQGGVAHALTWSPAHGGTVYAATIAGEVVALEAATGQLRWKFATPLGGFVVNPCVADGAVLLGSRQGVFYALEEADGAIRWQRDVKLPICHTAAAADGVVYFLDEGIHAHALKTADGKGADGWVARQLHGGSARFYWPVVTKEHVLLTVAPPHAYNWGETDAVLFKVPGVKSRKAGDHFAAGTPEQEAAEQTTVIAFLKEKPHNQVLHCLARKNGRPACTPGVLYTGGSGSECAPPVLTQDERIVLEYRSYYSLWDSDSWVNPYSALGTLDPATGVVTQLRPKLAGKSLPWGHIWIIADESSSFSIAGEALFVAHQGNFGGFDLASQQTFAGVGKRDTWGGYPPLSWSRQEWHGGPRSPLTIVDGTVYYVTGARVIACEGGAKAGEKNAEPVVVASPEKTAALPKMEVDTKELKPTRANLEHIFKEESKREVTIDEEAIRSLRQALARHVADIVDYPGHAPFLEWRGISQSTTAMNSAQALYSLSIATPYLESAQQQQVREYLERLWRRDVLRPAREDVPQEPRNLHRISDEDAIRASSRQVLPDSRQDFYSLLEFYRAVKINSSADARITAGIGVRIRSFEDRFATKPWNFDELTKREPFEQINRIGALSPTLTYFAGRAQHASHMKYEDRFSSSISGIHELLPAYLAHYRTVARSCLENIDAVPGGEKHPSAGGQFRNLGGPYIGKTHLAAIVYWTDCCPELGRVLREYAPQETEAIRRWMLRNAQGFYLVRWDTPVQEGEVGCPLYVTTQNYFHFFSTICRADFATHKLLVDRPACHADVYYIERLVRAIEASEMKR